MGDPLIPFPDHRWSRSELNQHRTNKIVCRITCMSPYVYINTNTNASPYTEQIFPCQLFGGITARRLVTRAFSAMLYCFLSFVPCTEKRKAIETNACQTVRYVQLLLHSSPFLTSRVDDWTAELREQTSARQKKRFDPVHI